MEMIAIKGITMPKDCLSCPFVGGAAGICEDKTHMTITKDELIRALTLLREREPVKPKKMELAPDGTYSIYKCGACGAWLRIGDNYCGRCGKEVKRE